MITFVTVNFNTPLFIMALCGSLRKCHPQCNIVVLDNSTVSPLSSKLINQFNIQYIDNTSGKILNFDELFYRWNLPIHDKFVQINNLGSAKHTLTIDWLMYNLPYSDIVLMDSDVLLKKPIDFIDDKMITSGTVSYNEINAYPGRKLRFLPYCQYLNLDFIRMNHIHYFHPHYIMGFIESSQVYDTGAYFYQTVHNNFADKCNETIDIDNYIVHYKAGSWKPKESIESWLFKYKHLWTKG